MVCERLRATNHTGQWQAHRPTTSTMKRNQSPRASSPTPTTFSGISNYRTESYRPVKDQGSMPAMPLFDPKVIARTHYNELQQYLVTYLAKCSYDSLTSNAPRNLPSILQHLRILARLPARSSPGSQSSSSKSSPLMYMTNSFAGRRTHQRMKVRVIGGYHDLTTPIHSRTQYPVCLRATSFTQRGTRPDRNLPHFQPLDSKTYHPMFISSYRDVTQSSKRRSVDFRLTSPY